MDNEKNSKLINKIMTEQEWHTEKYIDKGNTCAQDTFFYCSELYGNIPKYFTNLYTDYADCVTKKTPLDCGQEFSPSKWSGGKSPYIEAQKEDYKIIEDYVNNMDNYDPAIGYDADVILSKVKTNRLIADTENKNKMMLFGGALIIGILVIIKMK